MVEDYPFGNGMCWQIDELLTLYSFDPINTEWVHEPLLSELYKSVPSIPTHFDFFTDHIITHRGPNHWDGWTSLHLHKHATLWRYPVKRHHVATNKCQIVATLVIIIFNVHSSTLPIHIMCSFFFPNFHAAQRIPTNDHAQLDIIQAIHEALGVLFSWYSWWNKKGFSYVSISHESVYSFLQ